MRTESLRAECYVSDAWGACLRAIEEFYCTEYAGLTAPKLMKNVFQLLYIEYMSLVSLVSRPLASHSLSSPTYTAH